MEKLKTPEVVEKEQVANLKFPDKEVLTTADAISDRKMMLDRATTLGNAEHIKIKIIFEDDKGIKQTETTIWGVTDKRIILKKGVLIPIQRVHEIRIF